MDTRPPEKVKVPTKTSQLENDSGFAYWWDIKTNTDQLENGAGFITSAYVEKHRSIWADWHTLSGVDYVDYINSYRATFDTGVVPTVDTRIEGRFRGTSEGNLIVGVGGDEVSPHYRFFDSSNAAYLDIGYGRISTDGAWDTTKWNDVSVGNYWYDILPEGGSVIHAEGDYDDFTSTNTLKFSDADYEWGGNYENIDCAGFKIYEGETLVKDYRPALDPDGVACFFDEVS